MVVIGHHGAIQVGWYGHANIRIDGLQVYDYRRNIPYSGVGDGIDGWS